MYKPVDLVEVWRWLSNAASETARRELDRVMDAVRRWPAFAVAAGVTDENVIKALI